MHASTLRLLAQSSTPTRYMEVLRMTQQAMVDTPDEVTLELLDDWLAAFRTRNTLDDLRYSPASMTSS
jgi:hypothetical protein